MPSQKQLGFALVLGSLAALGPLCTDFYLPALPQLAGSLATTTATAQLSLTAGLLGLGAGQLVFGPLSDKLGRMRPLLFSLMLPLLASIACALAQNIGGTSVVTMGLTIWGCYLTAGLLFLAMVNKKTSARA